MNKNNKPICEVDKAGNQRWYLNGKLHREDGPAIITKNDMLWYLNGKRHREDGPAIILYGGIEKFWWHYDMRHRIGGPAVIIYHINGYYVYEEYWVYGIRYSKQNYWRQLVREGLCTETEAFIELL
jgi:hypothetical protein